MKGSTYERRYKNVMPESFFFFYFVIKKLLHIFALDNQ